MPNNANNTHPEQASAAGILAADDVALRVASHGLTIRVSSLEHGMNDIKSQLSTLSQQITNQSASLTSQFQSYISNREREGRTPWGILISAAGFLLLLCAAIGGLAYSPILATQSRLEVTLGKIADNQIIMRDWTSENFVSQKDLDARTERGKEDRDRTNRAIETIQSNIFTRDVHLQHWNNIDASIAATNQRLETARADLQRQLDMLQKALGDTWTARDALQENKARIADLEAQIREIISRSQGKSYP